MDENVTNKVEQIAKGLISSNVHSTLDPKNRMVSINLLLILVEWTFMLLFLSFHNEMLLSLDLVFQTCFFALRNISQILCRVAVGIMESFSSLVKHLQIKSIRGLPRSKKWVVI